MLSRMNLLNLFQKTGGDMWADTVQFKQLFNSGRWKVELYADAEDRVETTSTYPLFPLGKLFEESRVTIDPQSKSGEELTYIGMENVESNTGDLVGETTRLGGEIKSRSKVVCSGQVLYGRLRPSLNKVHLFQGKEDLVICSGEFFVLTPNKAVVLPRVLRELLASRLVLDSVIKFIGGAALPRISVSDLASIKVPVPPLKKQVELEKYLYEMDARRSSIKLELEEIPNKIEEKLFSVLGVTSDHGDNS